MADTKVSNLTAATDLVSAEIAGQQGGISKKFGKALWDAIYQPLAAALTSWAAVTRAAGFDTFTATPSSDNLRTLLTDETGTGAAVFANTPTLVTPVLGAATGTSLNLSGLTASQAVHTDGSKNLVSVTNTGTGNNVLSAAPTISGIPIFSGIPSLTGGALSFPAAQVASAGANDLDDYEEGTFTPTFISSGATFSYTVQLGRYAKIGRTVYFWIDLRLNTSGNTLTANALTIGALPFTVSASNLQGWFSIRWSNATTSYVGLWGRPAVSGTALTIEGLTAAGVTGPAVVPTSAQALHATNGSIMIVTGFYEV